MTRISVCVDRIPLFCFESIPINAGFRLATAPNYIFPDLHQFVVRFFLSSRRFHKILFSLSQIHFGRKRPELAVALRVLDDLASGGDHLTMESQRSASQRAHIDDSYSIV
jgi:hypothetical protein